MPSPARATRAAPDRASCRARLESGDSLACAWLAMGSPALVEAAAHAGPDLLVLDLQHGLFDRRDLEAAIGAVRGDVPVLVRVAENRPLAIGTALDAGAEGVIVPLVESAEEAAAAVSAARYPPHGIRSGGGVRPLADFAAYVAGCARDTLVAVMIETKAGLENAAAIAAVPGVDLVFIGTGDLVLCLGPDGDVKARCEEACAAIHAACEAAGTPCGIFTPDVDAALARRAEGYRLVVAANDIAVVNEGFRRAAAAFAPAEARR
ncbi:HpcH/HpaI aldolase family protein [Salinarimonas ramus]|uniref:Aldolase n=1 Tax=Salinarimonas ramus TaxID=690164 RepID=A0A917Q493_9HYPH|nr:aldolase/citrate lyase family protein [Salinarimonas ramus]GGK21755.1 aldolase [Salinarimonas ramus]